MVLLIFLTNVWYKRQEKNKCLGVKERRRTMNAVTIVIEWLSDTAKKSPEQLL